MKINPNVIQMFMFKAEAKFYAWKARRKGYKTTISREGIGGDTWIALGGYWSVKLEEKELDKPEPPDTYRTGPRGYPTTEDAGQ